MSSSSAARTPKLQLAVQQLLTGECWIPPKRDTPCLRANAKPQQDGWRGGIACPPEPLGELKQTLCTPGRRD